MARHYWLMKSEPGVYSIEDLERDGKTFWEGVRNYQARNFIRDQMKPGDQAFFYHSNADPTGIAGIAEITSEGYPDPSACDSKSRYFDASGSRDKPVWYVVDLKFLKRFPALITLQEIKATPELSAMALVQRGQRLSIQPVTPSEWNFILKNLVPAMKS